MKGWGFRNEGLAYINKPINNTFFTAIDILRD